MEVIKPGEETVNNLGSGSRSVYGETKVRLAALVCLQELKAEGIAVDDKIATQLAALNRLQK